MHLTPYFSEFPVEMAVISKHTVANRSKESVNNQVPNGGISWKKNELVYQRWSPFASVFWVFNNAKNNIIRLYSDTALWCIMRFPIC